MNSCLILCYNVVSYDNSYTPLHAAAQRGKPDVVRLLLDIAADVDEKDNEGYSN